MGAAGEGDYVKKNGFGHEDGISTPSFASTSISTAMLITSQSLRKKLNFFSLLLSLTNPRVVSAGFLL